MSAPERQRYATNRPIGHDGLTGSERTILTLHDAGNGVAAIMEQTPFSEDFIRLKLSQFGVSALEPWTVDARIGSAALAAAIRARFPERCGAPT